MWGSEIKPDPKIDSLKFEKKCLVLLSISIIIDRKEDKLRKELIDGYSKHSSPLSNEFTVGMGLLVLHTYDLVSAGCFSKSQITACQNMGTHEMFSVD